MSPRQHPTPRDRDRALWCVSAESCIVRVFPIRHGSVRALLDRRLGPIRCRTMAEYESMLRNFWVGTFLICGALNAFTASAQINFTVAGNVPILKQPTSDTCWATAATILVSWKKGAKTIQQTMDEAGITYGLKFKANSGLLGSEKPAFLNALGMKAEPPQNYTVSGWLQRLRMNGPLWITTNEGSTQHFAIHARVMIAIFGDGTDLGTFVTLIDPAAGSKASETVQTLSRKFEEIAKSDLGEGAEPRSQVVHY